MAHNVHALCLAVTSLRIAARQGVSFAVKAGFGEWMCDVVWMPVGFANRKGADTPRCPPRPLQAYSNRRVFVKILFYLKAWYNTLGQSSTAKRETKSRVCRPPAFCFILPGATVDPV